MDLPCEDPSAGNARYAEVVADALGDRGPVTLVGHSLGGLTVPLVAAARPVERMVFLCAFIPRPGEPFSAQFGGARDLSGDARVDVADRRGDGRMSWPAERAIPVALSGLHAEVAAWAAARLREQTLTPHGEPCPLDAWPDVPSSYILCRDDLAVGADWAQTRRPRAARDDRRGVAGRPLAVPVATRGTGRGPGPDRPRLGRRAGPCGVCETPPEASKGFGDRAWTRGIGA